MNYTEIARQVFDVCQTVGMAVESPNHIQFYNRNLLEDRFSDKLGKAYLNSPQSILGTAIMAYKQPAEYEPEDEAQESMDRSVILSYLLTPDVYLNFSILDYTLEKKEQIL